jgi:hypothetical protein
MARDKFHQEVRTALENDGWDITDDPLYMKVGQIPVHIDLGAEKVIGAERNGEKIAVEIKTFGLASFITALYEAIGKYIIYRIALEHMQSDRVLYLAMPAKIYTKFCQEPLVKTAFEQYHFKILLYKMDTKEQIEWVK